MDSIILRYKFKFVKNGKSSVSTLINAKILNWFFKLKIFDKLSFLNICALEDKNFTQFNNIVAIFNVIKLSSYKCMLNQLNSQGDYKYLANGTGILSNLLQSDIAFFNKKIDIHITSMPLNVKDVNIKKVIIPFATVPILICNIKNENNIIGFIQIKTKQFNHEELMKVINSEKDTHCKKINDISFK